jgi:hypothetical protein
MLAPDVTQTEDTMTRSLQAAAFVTIYAAAMRFQVSPLLQFPLPSWFDPIKANLETAIGNARQWQDVLCGQVAIQVPQSLIDYDAVFQRTAGQIVNLITEIEMGGSGSATGDQHQQANALIGALLTQLKSEVSTMSDLHGQTVELMDKIQQDYNNLAAAANTIATEIPNGGSTSQTIQAQLGDDFLDTAMQGTCSVNLSIKESIDVQIKSTAQSCPEILPYVIALKVLQKAQTENGVATKALSNVLTSWQLMQDLVQDTINDLEKADDSQVLPILQQAEVQAASQVWTQLKQFAETLASAA